MKLTAGSMVARRALPDVDHVMRFASKNKQILDPDTLECTGMSLAAFVLREDDKGGLSVTWIEHFGPNDAHSRALAADAYRESQKSKKLPKNGIFAWANVSSIKTAGVAYKKAIRVVHDPIDGNPGHAEVRHFTDEDLDLLDYLASDVFVDFKPFDQIMAAI